MDILKIFEGLLLSPHTVPNDQENHLFTLRQGLVGGTGGTGGSEGYDGAVQPFPLSTRPEILVVDRALRLPAELRELALRQAFVTKPGFMGQVVPLPECQHGNRLWRSYFEDLLGVRITPHAWGTGAEDGVSGPLFECLHGACETPAEQSWITSSARDYVAVLFLGPPAETAPDSGVTFYRHVPTHSTSQAGGALPAAELLSYESWEVVDRVSAEFNRLVVFRGARYHSAADQTGATLEDGNLILRFAFNVQ